MRIPSLLLLLLAACLPACSQQSSVTPDQPGVAVEKAMIGKWTGVLEYRDYSEPATSTKRVQLPTWLTISKAPEGLFFDYVYDDGPTKTVTSHHAIVIDPSLLTYRVMSTDAVAESYSVTGIEALRNGRGELLLTGEGKDAGKPAEIRTTLTIRRNLLSWLEEVRTAKSNVPFVFRHRYTFVRTDAPAISTPK